ncbi:phospholipase-like protein [Artemisia annua]|uniref:Phospholipase-like protein n=1 Tax=Artemisia annua TaxID=35608 RepID=A0A2U1MT71_ARTAN|nr:phospholipase-like protein [Artemisia annua]
MPIKLYKCKIAVRSTVQLLADIKEILSKNEKRERMFRKTVFGPWLDIRFCDNDSRLMHYVLQHQVKVSNISFDSPPLQFKFGDDLLEFGRKEFCLITGFRFGQVVVSENNPNAFRDRVFPEKRAKGINSVYANDCLVLVKDEIRFEAISAEDDVRLCLLVIAILVFMAYTFFGRGLRCLECFSMGGEYMWDKFYQRTVNVVDRHRKDHLAKLKANPKFSATYNMYGFAWAFKIWIFESFPKSSIWWAKANNVIPRGLAWYKCAKFRRSDLAVQFGKESIPIKGLYATKLELRQPWCNDSIPFIKGLADRDLPCDAEQDDGHQADNADDDKVADTEEDEEEADVTDDQHHGPSFNRVNSTEAPKETNVSTSAILSELFHLQSNLLFISKHIKSVPNQDIRKLFNDVKTRVSEIVTVLNANVDGGVVYDQDNTDDPNTRANVDADVNPDIDMVYFYGDGVTDDDHDVDPHSMDVDNPIVSKPTSLGCEADTSVKDSDAALNMEIEKECGSQGVKESQMGTLDVLIEAMRIGVTPDVPVLDEHEQATQVGAFNGNGIKQSSPVLHVDDDLLHDDVAKLINDDADANIYSLDDIKFDNENASAFGQKEPTTPLQRDVETNLACNLFFPSAERRKFKKKAVKAKILARNFLLTSPTNQEAFSRLLNSDNVQRALVTRAACFRKESIDPIVISDDVSGNPITRSKPDCYSVNIDPFIEDLSRPPKCKKDKVTLPDSLRSYLKQRQPTDFKFPWGGGLINFGRKFWLALACLEDCKGGWLPSNADWTLTGSLFAKHIMDGEMYAHYSNGTDYPVHWRDVEKVYFPVNEPEKHWCLAVLHLRTRLVSFCDTLGFVHGKGTRWWRNMKRILPKQLSIYLDQQGILESKSISAKDYKITYQYPAVPEQAQLYGDCGVWVCIIMYRLCHNQPLDVDDPLQIALAYLERMLEYFWKHKQPINKH